MIPSTLWRVPMGSEAQTTRQSAPPVGVPGGWSVGKEGQGGDCEIPRVEAHDVRFPTPRTLAGSDAMDAAPDYSAAYVILHTDGDERGYGMTFTCGRGTEIVVTAIQALAPLVTGRRLVDLAADQRGFWRSLASEAQIRWVGPEKGVIHLATAAVVNAVWDLWARSEGKPVWKLVSDLSPEDFVSCIDFRYMTDVLTPAEAIEMLNQRAAGRGAREAEALGSGLPAYTTSVGWLGYSDEEVRRRCRDAVAEGWTHMKMKVGGRLEDDVHRAGMIREGIGGDRFLMMDANQVWEVDEAIAATRRLAEFDHWWMEEPTSPDDGLGHARIAREVAPVRIAIGEHCQNRTMFKQFMQGRCRSAHWTPAGWAA